MKTIYIGFSTSREWKIFPAAIRCWEGTPYSHVYVRFPWIAGDMDLIYQASGLAVNFMGPEVFADHSKIIKEYELEISDETWIETLAWAAKRSGKPYSLKQILGMFIFGVQKKLGMENPRNPFADGRAAYVCSELVASLLTECLGKDVGQVSLDTLTPKDIDKLLESLAKPV